MGRRFWKEITDASPGLEIPAGAIHHPELLRLASAYRLTRRALDTERAGRAAIALLSVDKLYETWVLIALAKSLGKLFNVDAVGGLSLHRSASKVFLHLTGGVDSEIEVSPGVSLFLRPTVKVPVAMGAKGLAGIVETPRVEQEPDSLVLSIGGRTCLILDAKCRTHVSGASNIGLGQMAYAKGQLLAKSDDINVMHRYRDAIRDAATGASAVAAAVVVYPGDSIAAAKESPAQIYSVGVGSIPLRPDNPVDYKHLEDVLRGLLLLTGTSCEQLELALW